MRLALTGRNLAITPALRQDVTRRLEKLDRHLHGTITSAQVALQVQKDRVKADVRVRTTGDHELSGHGEAASARASAVDAIAKVQHQASRMKGRDQAARKRLVPVPPPELDSPPVPAAPARRTRTAAPVATDPARSTRVVRVRRAAAKPMRLEDAVLRLDAPPGAIVVFRDATLDRVQVLVRRADGSVGLVDPEG